MSVLFSMIKWASITKIALLIIVSGVTKWIEVIYIRVLVETVISVSLIFLNNKQYKTYNHSKCDTLHDMEKESAKEQVSIIRAYL